jgi:hypothetical protein
MDHMVRQLSGILVTTVLVSCNSSGLDPNAACNSLFPSGTECTGTPVPTPGGDSKRILATEMNLKWYDDGTSDSTEQTTYTASGSVPFSESRTLAVPVLVGAVLSVKRFLISQQKASSETPPDLSAACLWN